MSFTANKGERPDFVNEYGLIQRVTNLSGSADYTTSTIPVDTTIPQITEGKQFCEQAFTPKYASSKIIIKAQVCLSPDGTYSLAAIFKQGQNDTLASIQCTPGTIGFYTFEIEEDAGDTTERTYELRFGKGPSDTGCGINQWKGTGNQTQGGSMKSGLIIEEFRQKP